MDLLKTIFPLSFKTDTIAALVIRILVYLVVGIVAGVLIGVLSNIPVINIVCGLLGALVDLYCLAGIVILCLAHFNVLK